MATSTSSIATISMASHGHPSRNAPSGPLLVHFLHPMHRNGSTSIWPNGAWSSSGIQYMQSPTGQYGTHAGDPAHPVQHSVITANSLGRFFRGVMMPSDFGSILTTAVAMHRIIQHVVGSTARTRRRLLGNPLPVIFCERITG